MVEWEQGECPVEIVLLLDHAMEAGMVLTTWLGEKGEPVKPKLSHARAVEGRASGVHHPTWTVSVLPQSEDRTLLLEYREDERRWVGVSIPVLVAGAEPGVWSRFYQGPRLELP